jgi:hypothetical protein
MPSAQQTFLQRIATFKKTLDSDFLRDDGITPSLHNEKARLLRNGIAIIGFTILEDFIKDRTGEVLERVGSPGVLFNALSQELQEAITSKALKSIAERASNLKRSNEDWLSFIQSETTHIASTAGIPFSVSRYSLGWDKSNLAKKDITDFMSILNVAGGWQSVLQMTTKANSTLLSPENVFYNAAQRRHKAAHNPAANSLFTDLADFSKDVKTLAFAYDSLISQGLKHILATNLQVAANATSINVRFLVKNDDKWKEYNANSTIALRSDRNYNRILARVRERARRRNEIVVVKQHSGEIHNWFL